MAVTAPEPRSALVAGATGLIGRALLPLLHASPHYGAIHVLVRRPVPAAADAARLQFHIVDFARLPEPLPPVDDVYIALGTTIEVAGSQDAFRAVDLDAVVATACAARAAGATRLAVVSALGANANSRVFYSRVKGEMQAAIAQLGYPCVVIAQPSLLIGDRAALGQPVRAFELWTAHLLSPVLGLVPRGVRPIRAATVAAALIAATLDPTPGVRVLRSGAMQP